jgi:hypothetical protein
MSKRRLSTNRAKNLLAQLNTDEPRVRAEAWWELHQALRSHHGTGMSLIEELKAGRTTKEWIRSQQTTEGQIGALRLAAHMAGLEEEIWRDTLLSIGADEEAEVDLRAWALFSLCWAGLNIDQNSWDDQGKPSAGKALNDNQAKVRQWAAYTLGEMARQGKRPDANEGYSRLADPYTYTQVEKALCKRWEGEIDAYVARQLIISLGYAGGHVKAPEGEEPVRPIVKILAEAAGHCQGAVRGQLPEAVMEVADTITNLQDISPDEQSETLKRLIDVLKPWLNDSEFDYETYRSAIRAIAHIVRLVLQASDKAAQIEWYEEVARTGLTVLLQAAESTTFPESLRYRIHSHAVRAMGHMGREAQDPARRVLNHAAVPWLKLMLASPDDGVAMEVTDTLRAIMGEKEAAHFFADVVLLDDPSMDAALHDLHPSRGTPLDPPPGEPEPGRHQQIQTSSYTDRVEKRRWLARERAARALAAIPEDAKREDFNRLVRSVQRQDGPQYTRAHDALGIMGSVEAADALIGAEKGKWVQDKFFGPMDEADKHGRKILDGTVWMSRLSWGFTLLVSLGVTTFGAWLLYVSVRSIQGADAPDWGTIATGITGLVASLAGLLTPFFWNSASAVQKANAEMTRLVTAFHGYMGRMRLLGLGFADAYTKDQADATFLTTVSEAAGSAMMDSSGMLTDISYWPAAREHVQTPDFAGMTWNDAETAAKARSLRITLEGQAFSDDIAEGRIVAQSPVADSQTEVGSVVKLTLSKGANAPEKPAQEP